MPCLTCIPHTLQSPTHTPTHTSISSSLKGMLEVTRSIRWTNNRMHYTFLYIHPSLQTKLDRPFSLRPRGLTNRVLSGACAHRQVRWVRDLKRSSSWTPGRGEKWRAGWVVTRRLRMQERPNNSCWFKSELGKEEGREQWSMPHEPMC